MRQQLDLAHRSSSVEGGAIEVLEDVLRQRDTDQELYRALSLKRLEVGLKIRLMESDSGKKTVEVGSPALWVSRATLALLPKNNE